MQLPLEIFINGIVGVFAGMMVLYFAIKIISLCAGKQEVTNKEGDK